MIKRVSRAETEVLPLPGRDWHFYIGPENSGTNRVTLGVSVYPPGSRPAGHVHDLQEETIYCTAGRGRIVTPDETAEVEAGTLVWVPAGVFHSTEADEEGLELACFFTPPVVSGSYEKGSRA
jgi:quercetin dioxygenase-like cupin family protein